MEANAWRYDKKSGRVIALAPADQMAIVIANDVIPPHGPIIAASQALHQACAAQEAAEEAYHQCDYCEGERNWAECEDCSERFGDAIDMRRAALERCLQKVSGT